MRARASVPTASPSRGPQLSSSSAFTRSVAVGRRRFTKGERSGAEGRDGARHGRDRDGKRDGPKRRHQRRDRTRYESERRCSAHAQAHGTYDRTYAASYHKTSRTHRPHTGLRPAGSPCKRSEHSGNHCGFCWTILLRTVGSVHRVHSKRRSEAPRSRFARCTYCTYCTCCI